MIRNTQRPTAKHFARVEWLRASRAVTVAALSSALLPGLLLLSALGAEVAPSSRIEAASADLRANFTNWGLPLRSQGGRGTCSVFTMTGAIEYAVAQQRQQGLVLSVEFLNWASNEATTNSNDGGFFSDLWAGFAVHGICPEADLPYLSNFDPKLRPGAVPLAHAKELAGARLSLHWIKRWNVRTGLTDEQLQEIKRVLAKGWPVCGGFRWPKAERWDNGVLQMAPPEAVFDGHSVLLVGFREDPSKLGGGVFLIRNSGGGERDAAMPFEYVRAYMNDGAWICREENAHSE